MDPILRRFAEVIRDGSEEMPANMSDFAKMWGGTVFGLIIADRHPEGLQRLMVQLLGVESSDPMPPEVLRMLEQQADYIFLGEEALT